MNIRSSFACFRSCLPTVVLVALGATASAHPGHAGHEIGGIGWGLAHPFTGLDHLLAMLAVGLWAAQLGGRAVWMLPLSFIAALGMGAGLGMAGVMLPQMEPMILGSVFVLGALVALAARMPWQWSAAIVAVSALFHGQAHGIEMPADGSGLLTLLGLFVGSALMLAGMVAVGVKLREGAAQRLPRVAGMAIIVAAALIGLGVL